MAGEALNVAIEVIEIERVRQSPTPMVGVGRISVGDFSESFEMALGWWNADLYRASWRKALDVLEFGDDAVSCLVSFITDPSVSNFIFCWPLYRKSDTVFVQNAVLFLDELPEPFDASHPWLSVRPRAVRDEDGNRISEWTTSMVEIRRFRKSFG